MTRPLTTVLVLAALALGGLGACSSGSSAKKCPAKIEIKSVPGGAITVCGSEIKFDVNTIKVKPGPLTVTLRNGGSTYHTLKIEDTPMPELKANPGKSDTGTVTLAKGTYDFECTVPGHAAAGMKGKIVVG
jgi:plastocyanin